MYSTQSIAMASLTEHPTRSHGSRPLDQEPTGFRSHTSSRGWWSAALLLVGLTLALAGDALGAPIQVTTTVAFSMTECTLRNAITTARLRYGFRGCVWDGVGDPLIQLEEAIYQTDGVLPFVIHSGVKVRIQGVGGGSTAATISREDTDPGNRFFSVSGQLTLSGITLTGGDSSSHGGAIRNSGVLTVGNCRFIDNAAAMSGGAIFSFGSLEIQSSSFEGNTSGHFGGAVFAGGSTTTISGSTFSDSFAGMKGGAISAYNGELGIVNSTFSGNEASRGGAIEHRSGADTMIELSTFKGNIASYGGALYRSGGTMALAASAVEGTCFGVVESEGNNAVVDPTCLDIQQPSDQVVADLMLSDSLLAHGGLTKVHVPLLGSPLLDAYLCDPSAGFYDQRSGFPRYPAAPSDPGSFANYGQDETCDIGAYESICNAGKAFGATFSIPVYESQVSVFLGEVLNNGSCSSDSVDFGSHTSGCSIQWLRWGGTLEFQNIWFLEPGSLATHLAAGGDCFSDPEACKDAAAIDSTDATVLPFGFTFPAQTLPSHSYRIDVPGCASTAGSFRYVIEFASGAFEYWDPEIEIINP